MLAVEVGAGLVAWEVCGGGEREEGKRERERERKIMTIFVYKEQNNFK